MLHFRKHPLQHAIFETFRQGGGATPQQNNQQQQPNPGNMPSNTNPNPNPNPDPNNPDPNNPNPAENRSPMADFEKLWETAPVKEGQQPQPDLDDFNSFVPAVNVDPKKLMESAKRIDFSKVMNPERVQAALKGDVGAFNEVINSALQAAFANSSMATTKIVEAMNRSFAQKLVTQGIPHHMKKFSAGAAIDAELPILSNPAVKPMFDNFKTQLQKQYPNAGTTEIVRMAKQMVTEFADAVKGTGKDSSKQGNLNKSGVEGDDWGDFLGLPKQ